jgi:hypothetical protein
VVGAGPGRELGRTVMGHARLPRVVRLLHQASSSDRAGAGSSERTSPVQDTQRVSHSQGHARSHQLQPGIITEPLGSLTVIPPRPSCAELHCTHRNAAYLTCQTVLDRQSKCWA